MCRNIRKLRRERGVPTNGELHDAALQFIRKISGYREPSCANQGAFDDAVTEVADASKRMFARLTMRTPRRDGHQ